MEPQTDGNKWAPKSGALLFQSRMNLGPKHPKTQHLTMMGFYGEPSGCGQCHIAVPVLHVDSGGRRKLSWTQTAHCLRRS